MLKKLGLTTSHATPRHRPATMGGLFPSAVMELDATLAASYPGTGQVWKNIVTAPADASAPDAYDFFRGLDAEPGADDPVFVGTPGDSSAYWTFDGLQGFRAVGSAPLMYLLHRNTGSDFTFIFAYRYIHNGAEQRLFSTQNSSNATSGITCGLNGAGGPFLRQRASSTGVRIDSPALPPAGADYLTIISYAQSAAVARIWINARTATTHEFVFQDTSVAVAGGVGIGARHGLSGERLASGARLYHASFLNAYIDNPQAGRIIDMLNARHGRIYA